MSHELLETVILTKDLKKHGLRCGDLGTIVEIYEPDGLEVEFVSAAGKTEALVTLSADDVRAVAEDDLIAVRRFRNRSA